MNKTAFKALLLITIAAVASLPAAGQEQFSRDLDEAESFIPKGQWITGVSVNYSHQNMDKYQFLILENLSGDSYSFKVSPMALYCFKDNLAAGGKFAYERSKTRLDSGSLVFDSETSYDITNLYSVRQNFYGTAAFRNYISLGQTKRFGLFYEAQLELGGGQAKMQDGAGNDVTGTYERNFSLNIGLTPGLVMFLNNYSAIEVNVGVLGFGWTHTRSVRDRVYVSHRNSQNANFRINLFSISFGAVFYI